MTTTSAPNRWLILASFALVYLIWGSSYIGIRFAIETIPPFLMTGVRFLIAGGLLLAIGLARGGSLRGFVYWRSAAIASALMFLFNNSMIVWAQAHGLPSGVNAVLLATMPMWMAAFSWVRGTRPTLVTVLGLLIGFVGVLLLVNPGNIAVANLNPLAPIMSVLAAGAWAAGALYARTATLPENGFISTGMQLLTGGVMIMGLSIFTGDAATLNVSQISLTSVIAMAHLTIMSSVVTFTAFGYLMKHVAPAKVTTYAYVNPIIAMFLGWALANEPITAIKIIAAAIILSGVVLITAYGSRKLAFRREQPEAAVEPI